MPLVEIPAALCPRRDGARRFHRPTARLTRRLRSVCSNGVSAAALFILSFAGSSPAMRAGLSSPCALTAEPPWCVTGLSRWGGSVPFSLLNEPKG
jgi:hypothetical protein